MNEQNVHDLQVKLELLSRPVWGTKEIMEYFPACSKDKAYYIRREIIEKKGNIKYSPHVIGTDDVLAFFGTTRKKEIDVLTKLIASVEKHETTDLR